MVEGSHGGISIVLSAGLCATSASLGGWRQHSENFQQFRVFFAGMLLEVRWLGKGFASDCLTFICAGSCGVCVKVVGICDWVTPSWGMMHDSQLLGVSSACCLVGEQGLH